MRRGLNFWVRVLLIWVFGCVTFQMPCPVTAKETPLLPVEEELMSLKTIDGRTEQLLRGYLGQVHPSASNEIKVLLGLVETIMKVHMQSEGQNHPKYHTIQNHLKLIMYEATRLTDLMSGEQIQRLMKAFHQPNLVFTKSLASAFASFSGTIRNAPFVISSLPEALLQQNIAVLNEEVRGTLPDKVFFDLYKYYGQDTVYKKVLSTLIRPHGFMPIIVEPHFSGKSQFLVDMTRRLMMREYTPHPIFHRAFKNVVILHFEASWMEKQSIRDTLNHLRKVKDEYRRPLLVMIENVEVLHGGAPNAMNKLLDGALTMHEHDIYFIGTTTPEGFRTIQKEAESLYQTDLIERVNFEPLSPEDFIKVTKERLAAAPELSDDFGVEFEADALETLARFVLNEKNSRETPFFRMRRYLEDLAVKKLTDVPLSVPPVTVGDVRAHLSAVMGVPFSPDNPKEIAAYYQKLESTIKTKIVGQDRMIHEVLDVHRDLMVNTNTRRALRVVGVIGPTGVGKTELAVAVAKYAYGDESKALRIDGTAFANKENLWKLTGPTIGYKDSDQKGELIEYLDGRGRNGGPIIIDEGEKACAEFWQTLMPFFDEGTVVGGDGKTHLARNHLIIITSNRGDKQLYPKGFESWPVDQQKSHIAGFKQDQLKGLFTETTGDRKDPLFPDFVVQRIDRFVVANQADLKIALEYIPTLVQKLIQEVKEVYGKELVISKDLVESYVRSNFKVRGGYRPLIRGFDYNFKRIIQDSLAKMSAEDETLSLKLVTSNDGRQILATYSQHEEPLEFEFPSSNDDNVFRDPHIFERLAKLPDLIRKLIIGQNHIVEPLVTAVQKHVMKSQGARRAPLSFFMIGPTGTGKTELAKVLALGLMGSSDRVGIVPMGDINSKSKWGNYFGGDVGYQGGDVMRLFEQILRSNPQGGVIVFDEASNVGGLDRELKTELLKLTYNMVDEGRWNSPTTGIEYDLSKYIFLFTGNDGQDLYHGDSDDNLREATWSRNNKPERIIKILMDNGVPEPLLGRMAALFWARPLSKPEMVIVAEKFMEQEKLQLAERKILIDYPRDFLKDLVAHSYTVNLGARSVRNFIENAIGGFVAQFDILAFENKIDLHGSTVHLSFDEAEKKSPLSNDIAKRSADVFLYGRVESPNFASFVQRVNIKGFLAPRGSQTKKQGYETAIHEAGHAVVSDFAGTGLKILSITIDASGGYLGYVNYEDNPSLSWSRRRVIAKIASTLAGGMAQQMAGIGLDNGWSNDLMTARSFATKAIVEWGLGTELNSIFFPQEGKEKPHINEDVLAREVDTIMRESYDLTKVTLAKNWRLLLLLSKRLMHQYTLNTEEWEALKKERIPGKVEYVHVLDRGIDRMRPKMTASALRCQQALGGHSTNSEEATATEVLTGVSPQDVMSPSPKTTRAKRPRKVKAEKGEGL